jgi:hypothetical protein
MDVTFTKAPGRRYFMTVVRERGVPLAPRQGPGYHDYLPHDAVHFLVESEAGLSGGVARHGAVRGRLESALVGRILARLDRFAAGWHKLPVDGTLTLRWEPRQRPAG